MRLEASKLLIPLRVETAKFNRAPFVDELFYCPECLWSLSNMIPCPSVSLARPGRPDHPRTRLRTL